MRCSKCRKKIEKGIKFCPYCGMNLYLNTPVGQKKGSKKGRHRKKYLLILILLLFLVCLGIVMWIILSREINRNMLSFMTGSDKQNISYGAVMHDNGDITYRPGPNQISYDKESGEIYFNNLLMVYTFTDLSDEAAQKLADSVNGEIVGDISGAVNAQQILVRESEFEELNDLANKLMEFDDVLFAQVDYPIQLNENAVDSNPWSEDKGNPDTDRGNEKNPGGNDWWAEAVGAYTAWEYSDKGSPVKVGIIDSGFDIDHTDLEGQISFLPDYSVNSEDDHGTHVAGLIGAKNNSDGIRGVADTSNLVCVDWNPDSNTSYLSSGEYTEITKQLIEHNVQVINNSWAIGDFYSKEGYTRLLFGDSNDIVFLLQYLAVHVNGAYDSYVKSVESDVKRTGLDCIVMMTELLLNGEKDFLIVQGAGNGYCDMNKGVNTKYGGFYDAIDKSFFNLLPSVKRNELFQHKITYDNIDEHILVVGAVKNKTDKKGNYKITSFSNYGNNVDICAPGEEIFSTVCNNMYKQDSGTSMAAPIVSGSAALLWSLKPDMTASEVKELLISSAVTQAVGVGDGKGSQYPMLNVGNAAETLINANMVDSNDKLVVPITEQDTDEDTSNGLEDDGTKNSTTVSENENFKCLLTSDNDISQRTIGNVIFSWESNYDKERGTYGTIYVTQNGKTTPFVTEKNLNAYIVTNGTDVFYSTQDSGSEAVVYKKQLTDDAAGECLFSTSVDTSFSLAGYYDSKLYYIKELDPGRFYEYSFTTQEHRLLAENVTHVTQQNHHFYLQPYYGDAGVTSSLRCLDADNGKIIVISDNLCVLGRDPWNIIDEKIYYLEYADLKDYYSGPVQVIVMRCNMDGSKKEILIGELEMTSMISITGEGITYLDTNGDTRTMSFAERD